MPFIYYRSKLLLPLICLMALGLSACGGGDHMEEFHSDELSQDDIDHLEEFHSEDYLAGMWVEGDFSPIDDFINLCEAPRTGIDPFTGQAYLDAQGTALDENNFLRSVTRDLYLWYSEVTDLDPANYDTAVYFQLLKTAATTDTGTPKDQFHWSVNTDQSNAEILTGESIGYGATFALLSDTPPREAVVVLTVPNSPAAAVNLIRGARIISIDGVSVIDDDTNAGVDTLNEGMFPSVLGASHTFVIQDLNASTTRTIEMTSTTVADTPVHTVSTIETATGNVGYILFNDHINSAETGLINAINDLNTQGVSDLVLDLRYNGGGFLDIANELGYMIGGNNVIDKTFESLTFNDQHQANNPVTGQPLAPVLFHTKTFGFSEPEGIDLPTLNLDRVFVLAGSNTCSASESLMNSLRGADVEVIQIGGTTCGKPYGAYLIDNCGTSYFTIQFKGTNAKGYGDYADGLFPGIANSTNLAELPGCSVADDYNHLLGDQDEARLNAALAYRENGACPTTGANGFAQKISAPVNDGIIRKPRGLSDKILTNRF